MDILGFVKLPTIVALKGKDAAQLTADELNSVVTELNANGFGGVATALQSVGQSAVATLPEVTALQTQLASANTQLATVNTELTTQKTEVATLKTKLATAEAEVARLGALPGTEPVVPVKDTQMEGDSTPTQIPFWSETDEAIKLAKTQLMGQKI
jgi:hypothetical protein